MSIFSIKDVFKDFMPDENKQAKPSEQAGQMSVKFLFEKSPLYRSIHADGAWGRLDPGANIHMTIFNEKPQMPISGVIQNTTAGQWVLDENKIQFAHDAPLVREIEADVIMNLPAAVAVRNMLTSFINSAMAHMQNATKMAAEMENKNK
jgi:hypothetical protein